jgi:hypothetical protein
MKLKLMGLLAGLTLGGAALAQDTSMDPSQQQEPKTKQEQMEKAPMGGSGQQMGQSQINGTVVGYRSDELLIKGDNGAVVPIKVTHKTQLDGKMVKKDQHIESHLKKEFKEGEQVRTSFDVDKQDNVARTIDKASMQPTQ